MQRLHASARAMDEGATDEVLAERASADPEAFARLYDRYVERIYHYAYRRLSSHPDAEDITAQTFHRALEHVGRYESRGVPFGAWLFRIAHNLVVDRYRAAKPPLSLDGLTEGGLEAPDSDAAGPEERLLLADEAGAAWAAVARLPALQRRAVVLRFGRDLSHAEVGTLIGRSEAATKQLIYRAMKTLRQQLEVH